MAELIVQRSRDAKVFDLGNGRKQAVFTPFTHYQDDQGAWQDVDLNFRADGLDSLIDKHLIAFRGDAQGLSVYHKPTGRGIRFNFPRRPDRVANRTAEWDLADGTTWRLTARKTGLKTEATVVTKRGPKTYTFSGTMLGGLAPPDSDGNGNLVQPAGHFTIERPYVTGANGVRYETSGWTRTGGNIRFDFDDTPLPAEALPYVIDPTSTFNVAASGDDGDRSRFDTVYLPDAGTPSGSTNGADLQPKKTFDGEFHEIGVSLLRWDTSSIPDDATVDSATLRIRVISKTDANSRSLTAEWYEPGTITDADYTSTVGTNAHAGATIASITTGADNDFALINVSNVSKTAFTGLRLHISGGQPTGTNLVLFAAFDHATLLEPRLIVEYTAAGGTTHEGEASLSASLAIAASAVATYAGAAVLPATVAVAPLGSLVHSVAAALAASGALSAEASIVTASGGLVVGSPTSFVGEAFVGSPEAAGAVTHFAEAALNGSGALSADGVATYAAESALATSGAVSPAARLTLSAASALAASGALVADATVIRTVDAALSATGALAPNARMTYAGASALATTGTLTPSPVATYSAASALAASGTIAPSESIRLAGVAALLGSGTLAAEGALVVLGSAALATSGALAATGWLTLGGASLLSAVATITPVGNATYAGAAGLPGIVTLAAEATLVGAPLLGEATLVASGAIAPNARVTYRAVAALAASASLSPDATAVRLVQAALAGTGSLAAVPQLTLLAIASLAASGSLSSTGRLTLGAESGLIVLVSISATGRMTYASSSVLSALVTLLADALVEQEAEPVRITGTLDMDSILGGTLDADSVISGTLDADVTLSGTLGS